MPAKSSNLEKALSPFSAANNLSILQRQWTIVLAIYQFQDPIKWDYMLVINTCSKWPKIHMMESTTTETTIKQLQEIFSIHG